MESTGFHLQHQLQDEYAQYTSSVTQSHYKPSAWNSSNVYNVGCSSRLTESFINSRDLAPKFTTIDSLDRTCTEHDFGFDDVKSIAQQSPSDLLARINHEVSDNLPRLSEMINSPSNTSVNDHSNSFFSTRHVTGKELWPAGNFCHLQKPIHRGIALSNRYSNFGGGTSNLSILEMPSSLVSRSLGLNSQMLNLHTNYGGNCSPQLSYDSFGVNEESTCLSHSNMQDGEYSPSNSSNKISAFISGVGRTKRPRNCSQLKESEAKSKKSRPSSSPLKVRKEKLGDRIQALQKLVAPFGKTNTASVLTEAIGYIHFLYEQIQTLSVPHTKSSQTNPFRMVQLYLKEKDCRESKPDLRSRGLCLVPLSYASYIRCD